MKTRILPVLIIFSLVCFVLLPNAYAVVPPPDGGYPNFTTAEGQNALFSLTTGAANTAVGWFSLKSVTTGSFNTGVGAGTLVLNTGDENTATGVGALLLNTTGAFNTANGTVALLNNTEGGFNSAFGWEALSSNTTGGSNTAIGNTTLQNNIDGFSNTAIGGGALNSNTTGGSNTALGTLAGSAQTTGSSNVYIGAGVTGVAGESNACYIASIFGAGVGAGTTAVFVDSNGKLGTNFSSRRFTEENRPMEGASEALFSLRPVAFRYKKEIDPAGTPQLGLVAEDVDKVNPDLVVRDKEGKPYSVRYDQVNAMLLNEFLKEHRKVEQQQAAIAQLESAVAQQQKGFESKLAKQEEQIEALAASVQKVSAQLELSKSAPQTVLNNQ
jgi:hypothetical protein